jgi:hypothetical protein
MAGQEGFEPTTCGFGIRRSTVGATALLERSLTFFMKGVLATEFAEFFEFQLIGRLLLILGGGIILTFALSAIQTHDDAHNSYFLLLLLNFASKRGGVETPPH